MSDFNENPYIIQTDTVASMAKNAVNHLPGAGLVVKFLHNREQKANERQQKRLETAEARLLKHQNKAKTQELQAQAEELKQRNKLFKNNGNNAWQQQPQPPAGGGHFKQVIPTFKPKPPMLTQIRR